VSLAIRDYEITGPLLLDGVSDRVVEWVVEKWSKAAGKVLSPHQLRHHYATRLVRAKAPILTVSKLLGHESVATTQIYVSLDMSTLIDATDLDPMNRKVYDNG
jgi:site-specific recombinase XerC